jgi:hypothetical protein
MESPNIKYITELSSSIKDILKDGLDETDIVPLVFTLMKVMDKFKELKGVEKKTILLEFLNDYIDNNIQDEDKKFFLKKIVSIVLPEAINLLAKINKKKLKSMLKKLRNVFSCNK